MKCTKYVRKRWITLSLPVGNKSNSLQSTKNETAMIVIFWYGFYHFAFSVNVKNMFADFKYSIEMQIIIKSLKFIVR
jgi:hypothetical protein